MQKISPICSDTVVGTDPHEWIPVNFKNFLRELDHIIKSCEGNRPLFRGHADSRWLLESSFVRTCKKLLLDIESHISPSKDIRESVEYHQALFGLLLLKFDVLVRPSNDLRNLEEKEHIDAMFEMMKRMQQYPEGDTAALKGTFFIDWSQKKDIGIFFATFDANEHCIKNRETDGALFICDKTATGKTLQIIRVAEIIEKLIEAQNESRVFGCPLLFYPPKQILSQRATNQDAIYWAQMDLRYDLEYIWKLQEKKGANKDQYIFIRLILPYESKKESSEYLTAQKITHNYLFEK